MSTKTKIQWTDITWNIVRGCSLVSAGCQNCYAMKTAHRFSKPGMAYEGLTEIGPHGPRWNGLVRVIPELLDAPLRWQTPCRVFVNSMSDLFHEDVPGHFIRAVFASMALCPRHTFQILTKRPERMQRYVSGENERGAVLGQAWEMLGRLPEYEHHNITQRAWPLPNVWLGVSVEDQTTADERIKILLQTPAAVRFISAEPLLGPIDLRFLHPVDLQTEINALAGTYGVLRPHRGTCAHLNWIIIGGESGPGARPCNIDWIRSIKDQCHAAEVPVFVKQIGAQPRGWCAAIPHGHDPESSYERNYCDLYEASEIPAPCSGRCGCLVSRAGGDMDEWPEDLRVREYP